MHELKNNLPHTTRPGCNAAQPPQAIEDVASRLAHQFRRAGNGLGRKALESALLAYFQKTGK
jgi:hypothetical protein